jgi:hypothetical protein
VHTWKRTLLASALVVASAVTADVGTRTLRAADPTQAAHPEDATAQKAPAVPADDPSPLSTIGAAVGGVALLGLAGIGLTITFVSLRRDMRGRRNRYRRRVRREPRGTGT